MIRILSPELPAPPDPARAAITAAWTLDEAAQVRELLAAARQPDTDRTAIQATAADLVRRVRARAADQGVIEAFMRQYDLGSEEGVLLMCVAEALLRIPDPETADKLIRDKLGDADWKRHLGQSDSVLVNASTWGLMLTGHLVDLADGTKRDVHGAFKRLVGRVGEPVIRLAVRQAMRIMGHQFVMGRTISEALARSRKGANAAYRYSFDMLGEGALTQADGDRYLEAYRKAIDAIGGSGPFADVFAAPSISVKLSALHPRYEHAKRERVLAELGPRLLELAQLAKKHGIGLTIDAEETERLELSLDLIFQVLADASLRGWDGFGIVVQAYQKRAPFVIDFIAAQARKLGRRIPVRLVKGAYWDSEVKRAQVDGQAGYPVFTRKPNTDVSYQANARRLIGNIDAIYPMFATHNAQTIAAIQRMAQVMVGGARDGERFRYEFQKLHGMGDDLYAEVIPRERLDVPCRVYAPVGSHEDLLPYLVRRLLENGANSSFVHQLADESLDLESLLADPIAKVETVGGARHASIPLPCDLFGERRNSAGIDLQDRAILAETAQSLRAFADSRDMDVVGLTQSREDAKHAVDRAAASFSSWSQTPLDERADALERLADLLEANRIELMSIAVHEAKKTIPDALGELREAVDFCRYYAQQARDGLAPIALPGPTGERNILRYEGRGVWACIAPWNFPLAIFLGQVAAALVAGNSVVAKPAPQTPKIAARAVALAHQAGIPANALVLLTGGPETGAALVWDPRIAGVAFTGSTATARRIARTLLEEDTRPLVPLIAETGGINAMVVDSTALSEQVVQDVVTSAFRSAGQRCSALRLLVLQEDIAEHTLKMQIGRAHV